MARRRTNKNPRVFRLASNGIRGITGILNYGVRGVARGTGKVINVGTGAADQVLGATGRIFTGQRRRTRRRKTRR